MSAVERRALVDRTDPPLSVVAQSRLLKVARSMLYYRPAPVSEDDLRVMRRMVAVLRRERLMVNRKPVRRLMRVMGIEAIYPKPDTSRSHPDHETYPYLLRSLAIERPNQVWCADITYIPLAKGFVYVVAVMDWFSRRVLAWRLSISLDPLFCVKAWHGQPEIFNTDHGVQFTSVGFLAALASRGVRISMDGRGRYLDNIFIERLWRSLKYEEVFLKAYDTVAEVRRGIGGWLLFYNDERPHQALGYRILREVFEAAACVYGDNVSALSPYTQEEKQGKGLLTIV